MIGAVLEGKRAIVVAGGLALGPRLAAALQQRGALVMQVEEPLVAREGAQQALDTAALELGGADVIVHAAALPAAHAEASLEALGADAWREATHRSMLATLFCLQAAHRRQAGSGGAVVVLGPSTALVGAAGLVPLMTLAEAQRTLVKSAARQWGRLGMRLNWVGIALAQYAPALTATKLPQTPELGPPPPALQHIPLLENDVADVIAWLAGEGSRGITGATFNLDGGDWMVP